MKPGATQTDFHYQADISQSLQAVWRTPDEFAYSFENFFHPYVGKLIERLNRKPLAKFFDPNYLGGPELTQQLPANFYTALPVQKPSVKLTFFPKEIDVGGTDLAAGSQATGGPYGNYNWELFFHIPLTIAVHLSKTQRFAEAQRWFHYIFDPTCTDTDVAEPARFWKFLRFRRQTDLQQIDEMLALLSKPDSECTPGQLETKQQTKDAFDAIAEHPFHPHKVAQARVVAYQYSVVMKYLDNLIAWGDSLFMQDTIESINEATQRYVLAANLLGARPQEIPPRGAVPPMTYADLKEKHLDVMGNAYVTLEGQFPLNLGLPTQSPGDQSGAVFGIGTTLYFCLPRNEKLLGYWDLVADRLFKIRHCMNIEGVVRPLALFDPPLDPGMLVKAAAAGLDIGSIVSGLNQPAGPVRCLFYIQKALELASEVRGLGNALLSALEKGESEQLTLMRQRHEINIQQLSQEVRFLQWKQAEEATATLLRSRASALERYRYYAQLLGLTPDSKAVPDTFAPDRRELSEENFDEAYEALIGQYDKTVALPAYPPLRLAGGSSPANQSGATGEGTLYLSINEDADLNVHGPAAHEARLGATVLDTISAAVALIPDVGVDFHWWGMGGHTIVFGGTFLAQQGRFQSSLLNIKAMIEEAQGSAAAKAATYERRGYDWMLQYNLAGRELMQIGRQILSSLIAEQAARREYLNIQAQIAQAQEVDRFLHEKFTNEDLYGWMQGETSRLYYEYYRFAVDTARKAERTMKQELMRPEVDKTDFIQFNYWDGGRKGLLSGEALYLDIKRMELAYHENNKREFELTRHVSLRQLDPVALLNLKVTGTCEVTIPEWLYDLDCPGHYTRRLKSVAVSLPSVVGPYTSLNCTLSLLRSSIRKSPLLKDDTYARTDDDDDRFTDYFGSVQSVVTSGGSIDSGMFDTNLRDERFLPFEGAGAVSAWQLELPSDFRAFDYMTISDVILHIRYTAREGGELLGATARSEMRDALKKANYAALSWSLLLSLRHDFPTEWSAFAKGEADLALRIRKDYFPYMVQSETLAIDRLELYAPSDAKPTAETTVIKRAIDVPAGLVDELNGSNGYADVALAEDDKVLRRDATAQVFLIIRYSLST
jgi:Tc toxin complex TcA C-terminal TcB-binding domain